jgi:hypothetical protein
LSRTGTNWTLSTYCWRSKAYLITGHLLHNSYARCICAIGIPGAVCLDESLVCVDLLLSIPDVLTDSSTLLLLISDSGKTSLQLYHDYTAGSAEHGLSDDEVGSHHRSGEVPGLGPVGSCHCGKPLLCAIMCHCLTNTKHTLETMFFRNNVFAVKGSRFVHHTITICIKCSYFYKLDFCAM